MLRIKPEAVEVGIVRSPIYQGTNVGIGVGQALVRRSTEGSKDKRLVTLLADGSAFSSTGLFINEVQKDAA